ncbi:hypothetical protein [Streptomyces europaeiscabiei]|uniref:hypothetical protein n=1 Tax=Streptomyces europaeiscabiei TaxID=146819 RepID=UPI002E2E664B|nr:hypothetical protein [Streptomyces europaeiscabiei]
MGQNTVRFTWAAPGSVAREISSEISSLGAEVDDGLVPFMPSKKEQADYTDSAFEPFLIIAGVWALGMLIDKATLAARSVRHGGAVIDARNGRLEIKSNPAVPTAIVVVIDDNGTQTLSAIDDAAEISAIVRAAIARDS